MSLVDTVKGNAVSAYHAYYNDINPAPFAQLVNAVGVALSLAAVQVPAALAFGAGFAAATAQLWGLCAVSMALSAGAIAWSAAAGFGPASLFVVALLLAGSGVNFKALRMFKEWSDHGAAQKSD